MKVTMKSSTIFIDQPVLDELQAYQDGQASLTGLVAVCSAHGFEVVRVTDGGGLVLETELSDGSSSVVVEVVVE